MTWKSATYGLVLIFCLTVSRAGTAFAEDLRADFELNGGYRVDHLRWNIAGDLTGNNPNILSELTWSDMQILQINALTKSNLREAFFLQGSLNYGFIIDGKNQDSDYSGPNRTDEYSRSNNRSNGDNVIDLSFALGLNIIPSIGGYKLTPLFGYGFYQQNLRITNGYQTIYVDPDTGISEDPGPFSGLNSTYKASWNGPWIGAGLTGDPSPEWSLFWDFEFHWADYYGEGNWNLRDNLAHPVSFAHYTEGNGYRWSAGAHFTPNPQLALTLKYVSADWSTGPGIDRVFGAGGATGTTRLNEVFWSSRAIILSVRRKPIN